MHEICINTYYFTNKNSFNIVFRFKLYTYTICCNLDFFFFKIYLLGLPLGANAILQDIKVIDTIS